MTLVRVVNIVLSFLIIITVSSVAYGQDEDDQDQVRIPRVNDDGLQVELVI
jgi:hypothetical protein